MPWRTEVELRQTIGGISYWASDIRAIGMDGLQRSGRVSRVSTEAIPRLRCVPYGRRILVVTSNKAIEARIAEEVEARTCLSCRVS